MKKEIILIDLIGKYAGMDYYDLAFYQEFNNTDIRFRIFSNFAPNGEKPFLAMMFGKSKIQSMMLMLYNYIKLFFFCLFHRKKVYIYLSFGEITDFLFFTLSLFSKDFYVDIHELFAARYTHNKSIQKFFGIYYRHFIRKVIYHSPKTNELLNSVGFRGDRLYVPHFKYVISNNYDINKVGLDVQKQFKTNGIKFLFFGNLRMVKGIDVVIDYFSKNVGFKGIELVIAGKNVENIDFEELRNYYGIIDRHINDDEMRYLYSNTDYVLLPYRDSSQSGILEMAFTFKKPMLLSDIPYFNMVYSSFSSFGEIADLQKYKDLLDVIIKSGCQKDYYNQEDCDKFLMRKEIEDFKCCFLRAIV